MSNGNGASGVFINHIAAYINQKVKSGEWVTKMSKQPLKDILKVIIQRQLNKYQLSSEKITELEDTYGSSGDMGLITGTAQLTGEHIINVDFENKMITPISMHDRIRSIDPGTFAPGYTLIKFKLDNGKVVYDLFKRVGHPSKYIETLRANIDKIKTRIHQNKTPGQTPGQLRQYMRDICYLLYRIKAQETTHTYTQFPLHIIIGDLEQTDSYALLDELGLHPRVPMIQSKHVYLKNATQQALDNGLLDGVIFTTDNKYTFTRSKFLMDNDTKTQTETTDLMGAIIDAFRCLPYFRQGVDNIVKYFAYIKYLAHAKIRYTYETYLAYLVQNDQSLIENTTLKLGEIYKIEHDGRFHSRSTGELLVRGKPLIVPIHLDSSSFFPVAQL
jgi:hypothetical protein